MNIGWNIETYITLTAVVLSCAATIWLLRINWKRYGLLFLISSISGVLLCFIFLGLGLYSFPFRLFPHISKIPFTAILTVFPCYVLLGVRYSPKPWPWKIPFYWVMVHLGVFAESWAERKTQLIQYNAGWDVWDSYTWWWIYLLIFEWIGGMLVPERCRKPIDQELLRFGKVGWYILHFILICTIFLAGVYLGYSLHK